MSTNTISHEVAQMWLDDALSATGSRYAFHKLTEHFPRYKTPLITIAGYISPWMPASQERWDSAINEYAYLMTAYAATHCDLRVRADRKALVPDVGASHATSDILTSAFELGARSASFIVTSSARRSQAWVPFERSIAEYWLDNDCGDLCFTAQRTAVAPMAVDCVKALALRCLPLRDVAVHSLQTSDQGAAETLEQWLFRTAA